MAKNKTPEIEAVVPQIELSSSEQAAENDHVASTPQASAPESSAGALTGHTTERSIVEDDRGNVQAFHQTTVITDPESPLAVQIPDHPGVDGRDANPLGVHAEPTPEQAFAAGTAPEFVSGSPERAEAAAPADSKSE